MGVSTLSFTGLLKGASAASVGASVSILGELEGATSPQIIFIMTASLVSVLSGALMRNAQFTYEKTRTNAELIKRRRWAWGILAAQVLGGFASAGAIGGNIWLTIGASLAIGFGGTAFMPKAKGDGTD